MRHSAAFLARWRSPVFGLKYSVNKSFPMTRARKSNPKVGPSEKLSGIISQGRIIETIAPDAYIVLLDRALACFSDSRSTFKTKTGILFISCGMIGRLSLRIAD